MPRCVKCGSQQAQAEIDGRSGSCKNAPLCDRRRALAEAKLPERQAA